MGFRVWGCGFGVWGLGFRVWGCGFGVWGLGFRVWGWGLGIDRTCAVRSMKEGLAYRGDTNDLGVLGFGAWGLGFRVYGLGFGLWGVRFRGSRMEYTLNHLRASGSSRRPRWSIVERFKRARQRKGCQKS